ncbi:hypothetical protein PT2222_220149 [Paraburkholderia tropica]
MVPAVTVTAKMGTMSVEVSDRAAQTISTPQQTRNTTPGVRRIVNLAFEQETGSLVSRAIAILTSIAFQAAHYLAIHSFEIGLRSKTTCTGGKDAYQRMARSGTVLEGLVAPRPPLRPRCRFHPARVRAGRGVDARIAGRRHALCGRTVSMDGLRLALRAQCENVALDAHFPRAHRSSNGGAGLAGG